MFLHDIRDPGSLCEREIHLRILTGVAVVTRARVGYIGVAAAAGIARFIHIQLRGSVFFIWIRKRDSGSCSDVNKMTLQSTMLKGERQCSTVHNNRICGSRVQVAFCFGVRRAGDASSETKAALGRRPSASRWWSIMRVGERNHSCSARWSFEGV